ncbi:MAG: DUF4405 domain-containing protein [Selenomonadaceae bacterium]|nr:DUF4405 domain-containing protein [Selenomonadaceae bacterium]
MKRIALDSALLALFLLTMSFQFLPQILHEVLGLALLFTVFWHLLANRAWFTSFFRGKWGLTRLLAATVNVLLLVGMLTVAVTGCFISNYLFRDWFGMELQRSILVHQLHVSLPYLLLIFLGFHVGSHWSGLWRRFVKWRHWEAASLSYRVTCRYVPWLMVGLGLYGSFLNRVGDRLLMKHIFATEAVQKPFIVYLALLVGIMGLYAFFGCQLIRRQNPPPTRKREIPPST